MGNRLAVQQSDGCLRNVPEGQYDRSQARSAWNKSSQEDRPVGYGVIRAGVTSDSMIGILE